MIFEGVIQRAVDAHCARGGIIRDSSCHTAARGFVHLIDSTRACPERSRCFSRRSRRVNRLAIIRLDFLHEITIAVIDELRGLPADRDGN